MRVHSLERSYETVFAECLHASVQQERKERTDIQEREREISPGDLVFIDRSHGIRNSIYFESRKIVDVITMDGDRSVIIFTERKIDEFTRYFSEIE